MLDCLCLLALPHMMPTPHATRNKVPDAWISSMALPSPPALLPLPSCHVHNTHDNMLDRLRLHLLALPMRDV